jgi:hypothetical protein
MLPGEPLRRCDRWPTMKHSTVIYADTINDEATLNEPLVFTKT